MSKKIKIQAKEVSDAITKGLRQLGLRRDQVEVSILQHPKKGFLGIGSRLAEVELRPKRWSTAELDAQIYMDVPKRKSKGRGGRNAKGKDRAEKAEDETGKLADHGLDSAMKLQNQMQANVEGLTGVDADADRNTAMRKLKKLSYEEFMRDVKNKERDMERY